ncbi:hypothetical protein [Streptomyces sp. NPDC050988]|uniref:hypothetical protein n=1 Tax=Streptomyces sp. NPDC050988 TaxID=3365637 RepID=UPI003789E38D
MILEDLRQAVSRRNSLSAGLTSCDGEIAELIAQAVVSGLAVESALCGMKPLIPRQRSERSGGRACPSRVPTEFTALSRSRAWELLSLAGMDEEHTASDLLGSLRDEGHVHVKQPDVDEWLLRWEQLRRVRRVGNSGVPAYVVVDKRPTRPLAEVVGLASSPEDPVPYLVRVVLDEVETSGRECLHTGTIASALGVSPYELGASLCPLLRSVGVHRPGTGRVREVPGGLLAPGFTEACLRKAVTAFETKAEETRITAPDGR